MSPKDALLDEIRRRIHHHETLSSTDIRVADVGGREIAFELVDCNKYTLRDEFIEDFEHEYDGHVVKLVIETFASGRVTALLVDTTAHAATVEAFLRERDERVTSALEGYSSLNLEHVEALERWGAVGRLHELDAKHVHDAFHEHHRVDSTGALALERTAFKDR